MLKKNLQPIPLFLHRSRLRISIIKKLLTLDNFLRCWITFFSFEKDTHIKHCLTIRVPMIDRDWVVLQKHE